MQWCSVWASGVAWWYSSSGQRCSVIQQVHALHRMNNYTTQRPLSITTLHYTALHYTRLHYTEGPYLSGGVALLTITLHKHYKLTASYEPVTAADCR